MRTLFAKILIWFWATLFLNTIGSALISGLSGPRPYLLARLVHFQLLEARTAYESGGRAGLQQFMDRFHAVFTGEGVLTDASGRNLLTGADESALITKAVPEGRYVGFRPRGVMIARRSDDGRYTFLFAIPHERLLYWFLLPQHWWMLGAGVFLCYVFSYYLTYPVRRLDRAVERFGHGDFSARAETRRHDELGELARTFDRMADRIQSLLAAQNRLLLDISHELRSPLARLRVAVELARSGENRERALERIDKEADRLNALVSGLLQVTRAEGDPHALHHENVRLDLLLEELVMDAAIEAQPRGTELNLSGAQPRTIQGDPELLRRAIENVIRNAIRHAPEGTPVDVSVDTAPGRVSVRVRDYGTGVPEDALNHIFDAFYRVESDRDRASGGAGLGLSIARRAVELHQGSIRARNAHPGLLVEIDLPANA